MDRARLLRACRSADLLWIEYEALPYMPFWLEDALMPSGVPYVVDYDDAVFHNYDLSRHWLVRKLLGRKIDRVMAGATAVICGNSYLADRARHAGASSVETVPTVVDADRYLESSEPGKSQGPAPVIGWIGSPSTQRYVLELKPVLERLHRESGARLVLVGAQAFLAEEFGDLPVEVRPWSEESEARSISEFDIGIMPLLDGPWERGKCGYKLIQYMAGGKPVVASPIGVNREIVEDWACGVLADGSEQWFEALSGLLNSPEARQELGKQGRRAVEEHYSLQVQAPRLASILRGAADNVSRQSGGG